MSATYFTAVPSSGDGDLLAFRDAAITYAACRRNDGSFRWQADPAVELLFDWLGLEGQSGEPEGVSYLDPSRSTVRGVQARSLADGTALSGFSLDALRTEGMVAEAVFAALIRSSYGPDGLDYFPTRSELGFYFDEAILLQGQARWDEDYLQACQAFFMEELTPAELVEKSLASLPWTTKKQLQTDAERFTEELHGVTFLVAEELLNLKPLARLLERLLSPERTLPALSELLQSSGSEWSRERWTSSWSALSEQSRSELEQELCSGFAERAPDILFTAGPELLRWRAGQVCEVSS